MCPVIYSTQQSEYEPFSRQGFHSLDPTAQIRKRNIHSAVIFCTVSVQAKYRIHSMKERQAGEGHRPYTQPMYSR